MRVLAVDTTSPLGSVAIVEGAVVRGEERLTGSEASSVCLLPAIERLLGATGLDPFRVEAFAAAVGPGSFTSLRVGLSTVQGLALAADRPCLGVSVLDVLASGSAGARAVVLREAFRGEVFWAVYDEEGRALGEPGVGPLAHALDLAPPDACFVGDAASTHRVTIADRFPHARFPPLEPFLAAALGLWAEPRLRAGQGSGPESLRPLCSRGGCAEGTGLRSRRGSVFAEAAGIEDASTLAAIESACVGGGWNEGAFAREIRTGSLSVVVLRAAHGSVETRGIAAYCAWRVVADEMEVLSLAVRPEWRRLGLARWLLRLALSMGNRKGALSAFLEVRSGNGAARQLYASLGFKETGRRHGYYTDPADDAIVLFRPSGPGAFNS